MDQELQDLMREIRELTLVMQELGETAATAGKNLGKSFGAVEDKVKKTGKLLDQFGREIDTAVDNTKELNDQTEKSIQKQKKLSELSEREFYERRRALGDAARGRTRANELIDEFTRAGSATSLLKQGIENLGGDSLSATAGLRLFTAGVEGAGRAVMSMAQSLYTGERGAKVSADALGEFAKTVGEAVQAVSLMVGVLSWFGPGGWIFKALKLGGAALGYLSGSAIKLAADFNKLAADQNDKLFRSFNDLSRVGASAATGMQGVFQDLQTLGMSVSEIEKFGEMIKANSKTLALFGATAADGTREFSKVAGGLYKSRLGEQLELLGITANDQREATLSYMSILARTGQLEGRSTDQLIKGSAAYAKELDALARLTGQSREETAKQMEAANADARFRAAIDDARARGDEAALKRLELARSLSAFFESQGLSDLAAGTRALAAGRGAVTTPQAIMAMNAGVREALESGDTAKAMEVLSRTMPQFNKNVAGFVQFGGNIEGYMGDYAKMGDAVAKFAIVQRDFGGDFEAFNKAQRERGKDADVTTVANVQAARAQQSAALMMDTAVATFNTSARINQSASEAFRDAVNVFNRTVGARPVPGGVPTGGAAGPAAARGPATSATDLASMIVRAEGGSVTARNPYSSASGLGQITKGRYKDLVKEAKPGSALYGTTFEQYQGDANLQRSALDAQIESIRGYLASKGLSTTDAAVYMAHVFGPAGARSVLTHADSVPVTSLFDTKIIGSNPAIFNGVTTVGDLKRVISDKMGGSGYRYGGVVSGPRSGYSALLHGTEAVVPLPDGRNIPVKLDNRETNESLNRQLTTLQMQLGKMDEMIGVMRENNSISSKILQVSRN